MKKQVLFLLPFILLSALTGIWAGWFRIGWFHTGWNAFPIAAAGEHGALMVGSFLSTLICLERAVALKNRFTLLIPMLNVASLVAFWLKMPLVGYWLLIAGSLGYVGIMAYFVYRFSEVYLVILFVGAVCNLIGNTMLLLWQMYPVAVPWWMAFLLLTITAERLELSKFLPFGQLKRNLLYAALALFCASLLMPFHGYGRYALGLGMIGVSGWLLHYDMARKSVRKQGIHRYSGVLLLSGFGWLGISGALMLTGELVGFRYDAALHSFFVGFVFMMVFAHAPIILPGLLGLSIKPYRKGLYTWYVLLSVSLLVRIGADWLSLTDIRKWAGLLNGFVILAFFVNMAILLLLEIRRLKTAVPSTVKLNQKPA